MRACHLVYTLHAHILELAWTVKTKEKTIAFCETLTIILLLLLSTLASELVENIHCDFRQQKMLSLAMVRKKCHIS